MSHFEFTRGEELVRELSYDHGYRDGFREAETQQEQKEQAAAEKKVKNISGLYLLYCMWWIVLLFWKPFKNTKFYRAIRMKIEKIKDKRRRKKGEEIPDYDYVI